MAVPDTLPETLTIEEFERLEDPLGYRLELVSGVLVREPQPGGLHGLVTTNVVSALREHCRPRGAGLALVETGYALGSQGLVRRPDVSVVLAAHVPAEGPPEGVWRRPPDLAVEVVSQTNTAADIEQKVAEYLAAGTPVVWVVYPRTRSVTAHRSGGAALRLGGADEIDGGDVLPGFRVPIRSFFEV